MNGRADSSVSRTDSGRTIQRRTGGRTAKVTDQVLKASARILLEQGYEALGHRQVALAAGIADTTVYRRWPTKAELVLATVQHMAGAAIAVPDLGKFEADLHALCDQVITYLSQPAVAHMVSALVAALAHLDGAEEARRAFWQERLAGAAVIVEKAITRGEAPVGIDPFEVIEALVAPIYLRLLITGGALDAQLCKRVVRNTLVAYGVDRPDAAVNPNS